MRKIIVLEHPSPDGVVQGPDVPDEDTSGVQGDGEQSQPE
jgi:hypothetical protein